MKYEINTINAPQLTRPAHYFGNVGSAGNANFNNVLNAYGAVDPRQNREHHSGLTAADYLSNRLHLKTPKYMSVSLVHLNCKANKDYAKTANLNRSVYKKQAGINTSSVQKTDSQKSNSVFQSKQVALSS